MPSGNLDRKARLKKQTRLTFEALDEDDIAAVSSPLSTSTMSPARVRFSKSTARSTTKSTNGMAHTISSSPLKPTTRANMFNSSSPAAGRDGKIAFKPMTPAEKAMWQEKQRAEEAHRRHLALHEHDEGSSDSDVVISSSAIRSRRLNGRGGGFLGRLRHADKPSVTIHDSSEEESEDEEVDASSMRAKKTAIRSRSTEVALRNEASVTDVHSKSCSEEAEPIVIPSSPVRASQRRMSRVLLDSDDDDLPDLSRSTAASRKRNRMHNNDLEEDEEGEEDSGRISSPTKRLRTSSDAREAEDSPAKRTRSSPAERIRSSEPRRRRRTAKEKALELMRRKRAGEKIDALTASESESEDDQAKAIYDSDSSLEVLSRFDDEEEEQDVVTEAVRRTIRTPNTVGYDSDFVDDDDDVLGAPPMYEIPLEFTQAAHKPLKEHFKDCIEWMVQKKINPAFDARDPIYVQAFRKMDDEVRGLAASKFTSSVWREDFSRALYARPQLSQEEIPAGLRTDIMYCGACGRSRPTAAILQFHGQAYDKATLETVEPESELDSESGSNADDIDRNEEGFELAPESTRWHVGSECAGNAEHAHALIHWKHALNEWVVDQLTTEGHMAPRKLAEREKQSVRRRCKLANSIVDEWEASRQLKELWRDFKLNIDEARNYVPGKRAKQWGR